MFSFKSFLIVSCFCGLVYSQQEKLKVSVYYESLCPDSINFIVKQFYPVYSTGIKENLDVDLVPYGKAAHSQEDGKWTFVCQHGPSECYGNKIQACVLNGEASFEKKVAFVRCVMGSYDPAGDKYAQKCAEKYNMEWNEVKECANGDNGDKYLAKYGDQTHKHKDVITFVPTIMYNDKFDKDDQKQSLRDFKTLVCSKLNNTPSDCN